MPEHAAANLLRAKEQIQCAWCLLQYNMTKESVGVYQERVEMSRTIAAATEKKAAAAEQTSSRYGL